MLGGNSSPHSPCPPLAGHLLFRVLGDSLVDGPKLRAMRPSDKALLTVALLLSSTGILLGQEERRTFPLRGQVMEKRGLSVRSSPPTSSPFSYRLAGKICGIGKDSEFVASEENYIANGEIWFHIQTTKVVRSTSPCTTKNVSGWMVAKFKSGWAIKILEQDISTDLAPVGRDREGSAGASFLINYVLVFLGTAFAVVIFSIMRARNVRWAGWFTGFTIFEMGALGLTNVLIVALWIHEFYEVSEPGFLFHFLSVLQRSSGGFFVIGFVLSAVLLKFTDFNRNDKS